jgi:pimeloyl-ACP methyl ester carboxylesterase
LSTNQIWDDIYKNFLEHGNVCLLSLAGHAPSRIDWSNIKDMKNLLNIQNNVINKIIKEHKQENKKIVLIGHSTGGTFALMTDILFSKKYHAIIALTPIVKLEVGLYSPLNIPLNILSKTKEEFIWKSQFDLLQYTVKNHNDFFNFFMSRFGISKKNLVEKEKIYIENFSNKILEQNHLALKSYSIFFNDVLYNKENSLYNKYQDFLNGKIKKKNKILVIGGKEDLMVAVQQQKEAAELLNANYIEFENCGHFCTLDSPQEIFKEIIKFLF